MGGAKRNPGWAEANDPNTEWVDGEEFMTRFEAEINEAEKAESAR